MLQTDILQLIEKESKKQKLELPNYPIHQVAQAALINADAGYLIDKCVSKKYKGYTDNDAEIKAAAISIVAQTLRFIESLD